MKIKVDRISRVPVYQQISRAIESRILSEELSEGFKLPAERKLADEVGVHRNTIIKAYDTLISKGLVTVSRKEPKGYFVRTSGNVSKFSKRFFPLDKTFRYEFKQAEKIFNDIYWSSERTDIISFGGMIMNRKLDKVTGMENVVKKIFDYNKSTTMESFYNETAALKDNICRLLSEQNIYVRPKNVQILAESNQIISYLMMLYLKEGDYIVAEAPMVPDNFNMFYNRGINVVTVPMEQDGMKMDILEDAIQKHKPKFIYTSPNYHNPTGITMSLVKRKQLLKLAECYNIPIIEEDYQRDFAYDDQRLPSLYVLDTNKLVIYVYSFTLIFPYMMKIGYAVGPADLIEMLYYALSIDETAVSGVGQYFLNEYINSGQLEKHIEIIQKEYKSKQELMCLELDKIADKGISYYRPKGGLLIWCTLNEDVNERMLCKIAEEKGVQVIPGWIFYDNNERKKNGHIRLCFSNVSEKQIRDGIRLLGEALDESKIQSK